MSSFRPSFHGAAKRVMVLMMLADDKINPAEVEEIRRVYLQLTGQSLTPRQVHEAALAAQNDGRTIHEFLSVLTGLMSEPDRGMVYRAAYMIAMADGVLSAEERALLEDTADVLRLSPSQVDEIKAQGKL